MMATWKYSSGLGAGMYAGQGSEQANVLGGRAGVMDYMSLACALLWNGGGICNSSFLQLDALLRGELAAVETYERAIRLLYNEKEEVDTDMGAQLLKNLYSHQKRVALLRGEIAKLGGEPGRSAGIWGGMTKALQSCAAALDPLAALTLLAKGEAYGTASYQKRRKKSTAYVAGIVQAYLLPEQLRTQSAMDAIVQARCFHIGEVSFDPLSGMLHER